jgi:ornithine cyclodeaminase/alanine dehydrogenase-like protein (mu-crystallin family)
MLIINNADISKLLTMSEAIDVLDQAYRQLVATEAVCRPRTDIQIPTKDNGKVYQWSSVEGGSTSGYFAIRMKSDIIYEQEYKGARTQEKYCIRPGVFCGLILLTDTETGEPLAILNDGMPQLTRVGADGGIGVRYMAKSDAEVIGMLGSGGMSRTHMEAFMHVRPGLKRLQIYSPTKANRERFRGEMAEKYGIEVTVCDEPNKIYHDADIVAVLTDSAVSVIDGRAIEKGTHIVAPGAGGGIKNKAILDRIDVYFRFGSATPPWGASEFGIDDEYFTYAARPDLDTGFKRKKKGGRGHGALFPAEKTITFADIVNGTGRGRTSADQISYSERGNLQGNQFWALAGRIFELAKAQGVGREIPTDWFLQDIRD